MSLPFQSKTDKTDYFYGEENHVETLKNPVDFEVTNHAFFYQTIFATQVEAAQFCKQKNIDNYSAYFEVVEVKGGFMVARKGHTAPLAAKEFAKQQSHIEKNYTIETAAPIDDNYSAFDAVNYDNMPEPPPYFDENDRVTSVTKSRYDCVTKNEVVTVTHGFSFSNGDELATNAKAPDFLINGILESDSHGMLSGASMAFKTFVAIGMVHSICTGADFMGQKVYKTGKVLYVCGEGDGALSRRIKAKQIVDGGFNGNLIKLDGTVRIDNKDDMARLKQAIEEIQPVLVVFDTFASLVSQTDENSPSDVGRVLRLIKETCRNASNTSSMIVHHHGKDASKGMRGASNFTNDVDFSFELNRNIDSMMTTLSCKKMKDGENFNDIHIMARVVELGLIKQDGTETTSLVMVKADHAPAKKSVNKLNPNSERALSKLREAITAKGIATPEIVAKKYPDNPEYIPRYVVTIEQWREFAFSAISVNSDPADKKKHDAAKRKALWESKKQLESYGFIAVEGDYIWAI